MPDLGAISKWQSWFQISKTAEPLLGGADGTQYNRIPPINSPAISGEQYFRVLAQNPQGNPRWRLAGDVLVRAGNPSNTNAVQINRFDLFLNRWILVSVTGTDGEFFISIEPCFWHRQIDLFIERFDPQPTSGGGGSSTAITVTKNAAINPSFEIWHQTASDIFSPTGIERITLAPGWAIRSWTNQGGDFGTIGTSRKSLSDPALPFATYLRWQQLTPKDDRGVLYLANQVNEQAIKPGDIVTFHGYARVASSSGFSINVVLEGGGHPWTSLGSLSLNSVWAPFSLTHQFSNSLPANLYGLSVQFMMPSGRTFDLEVGGMQLEVNGAPTDLELYLS